MYSLFCSQERKNPTIKEHYFHKQGTFPQSRNFSTVKEPLHTQGTFPHSRSFSTIKDIFYKKSLLDQGYYMQTIKFSIVKETFHKKVYLTKEIFYKQSFSQKMFSLDQRCFLQTKIFTHSKNVSANKYQKKVL